MFNLFLRTVSQGLQAFIPIAASWTWFRRSDPGIASAIGLGALLSIPATLVGARVFAGSTQKALDESILAAIALVVAGWFLFAVCQSRAPAPSRTGSGLVQASVALATVLIVVRQSMEMGATFGTAFFELRSFDATRAVVAGALLAAAAAALWLWIGRRLSFGRLSTATRWFAVLFICQVLIYGLHEASEAGLLPFSEAFHAASEPYGPDGVYGLHFSDLLIIVPFVAAALTRTSVPPIAGLVLPLCLAAGSGLTPGTPRLLAAAETPAAFQKQPHVVFRDTTPGAGFGMLSVAPLDTPEQQRASTGLSCERVSFSPVLGGGGRGLCLHSESTFFGLFTGYTAIVLDASLVDRGAPLKLEGKPSRSRVSADGKTGVYTVFVFGDGYTSSDFSTRTVLVDMASGSPIADLENFTTYRNGEKFSAKDFNFWGVTFARDGDTFYASLRTAGKTYLVRGAMAARTVTVLRENVECPSLSPDGRRLAFKKFIGPDPGAWRIATLDLATMQERLVAGEARYVDDQMEWLDADRILYAVPRRTTSSSDVWVVPVDGETPARIFLPLAESPIVVR
jgi:hypothetical protein